MRRVRSLLSGSARAEALVILGEAQAPRLSPPGALRGHRAELNTHLSYSSCPSECYYYIIIFLTICSTGLMLQCLFVALARFELLLITRPY